MKRKTHPADARQWAAVCLVLLCLTDITAAHAWSLALTAGARRLYLHVGNGNLSGTASNNTGTLNGTVGTGGFVNLVQVTVPFAQLGNGTPLAMTSDSTQNISRFGDNNNTCATPASQVMVGAGFRNNANNVSASLTVSSPANLTNASGDTIPFSQISWTVSAAGSPVPGVIAGGTFNGGSLNLATVPANRYIENCHTFSYANSAVRASGTYNGRVTYTLAAP